MIRNMNKALISKRCLSTLSKLQSNKDHVYVISTGARGIGLEFTYQLLHRTEGK